MLNDVSTRIKINIKLIFDFPLILFTSSEMLWIREKFLEDSASKIEPTLVIASICDSITIYSAQILYRLSILFAAPPL
jgi:hypothetical protein